MDTLVAQKLEAFFLQYKPQHYKKGELMIRADDEPSGIFYLKNGTVKKYAISQKGEEIVINIFRPISFFPMSWAINNTPNKYFYEAMSDVEIWKAPKKNVVAFIKEETDVMYDLLSRVYKGTDGMETRMAYLMAGNAYGRLVIELVIEAQRFGEKIGNSVRVKISERELAAQTGMTRETVSRELKILKDKDFVSFEKNTLLINNIQVLEQELKYGV